MSYPRRIDRGAAGARGGEAMDERGARWAWATTFGAMIGGLGCGTAATGEPVGEAPSAIGPTCVTIQRGGAGRVADTKLRADQPTTALGAQDTVVTGDQSTQRVTLLRFDLSPIPAGMTIDSATVTLSEISNLGPGAIDVHRVAALWDEGTATWNSFQNAYDPAVIGSFSNGGAGHQGPVSFDLTPLAKSWYAGAPSWGVALIAPTNSTWASSESATASQRPSLTVCYSPPGCGGKPDGASCDDGDACTAVDTCHAGACVGSNPLSLAQLDNRGAFYACGVAPGGDAYCWGHEASGELGSGDVAVNRASPVKVAGGIVFASVSTFSEYSASQVHACGLAAAGDAYCWGDNTYGELGDGTLQSTTTPVPVAGGLKFASISTGSLHTCGITLAGDAYCWGDNIRGEIGMGAFGNLVPSAAKFTTPVAVAGGLKFSAISAGGSYYPYTCGVAAGAVYCWGNDAWGTLGNGSSNDAASPSPIASGATFASVSAGPYTACAVTTSGDAYCWGNDTHGELGTLPVSDACVYGPSTCSRTPLLVPGGIAFASISVGAAGTCGVTTAGAAYCWGDGSDGALGDGTFATRATPGPVSGGLAFTSVTVGNFTACGRTVAGEGYCWGNNGEGELGKGTFGGKSAIPLRVVAGHDLSCTGDACHGAGVCDGSTGICSSSSNGLCGP
jgi:alpha-tubulin suppressor-like RCC1 family protein